MECEADKLLFYSVLLLRMNFYLLPMSPECEHTTHRYTNYEWEDLQYLGLDFVFFIFVRGKLGQQSARFSQMKQVFPLVYFKLVLRVLERKESKLHA